MNGFNQYGNQQGMGFQPQYPQQQQFNQQRQQSNWYNFQDGDNWVQLLDLRESPFQTRFGSQKVARDVLVNGQKFAMSLPNNANQQLQQAIQAVLASGKNPLEFKYNIRKNRFSPVPADVRYQVVTGEWVGLQPIQLNAYSQQRTQAQQSPTPPIFFQQRQMPVQQPMPYPQNAPQMPVMPMAMGQISIIPQQVAQNPFQQGISPNAPIMPIGIQENAIVLDEHEKSLLSMAEQSPEKLEKADFINTWVSAMRTQFSQPNYSIQRANIVYGQFYQK